MNTHDINSQILIAGYTPLKFQHHNQFNKDIQKYLNDNNINLKINICDPDTLYIRNFSDNIYYEIYISNKNCSKNIYKLDIIRCIVRNDDWIANRLEMSVFCDKEQIIERIKSTNIEIDNKLYNLLFNALCYE
jgi:hypothetical protein